MSNQKIVAVYTKLEQFELGKDMTLGQVSAIGTNKQTGDLVIEYLPNLKTGPSKDGVMKFTVIPREQITRLDGERMEGPTLVTPTGLEV